MRLRQLLQEHTPEQIHQVKLDVLTHLIEKIQSGKIKLPDWHLFIDRQQHITISHEYLYDINKQTHGHIRIYYFSINITVDTQANISIRNYWPDETEGVEIEELQDILQMIFKNKVSDIKELSKFNFQSTELKNIINSQLGPLKILFNHNNAWKVLATPQKFKNYDFDDIQRFLDEN
jgi:hypothetical protein